MIIKILLFAFCFSFAQNSHNKIDGIAAIVENHIVLKSDLAQMVNMALVQNNIDPLKNQDSFIKIQSSVLQSMIDQKIMLEMAEKDSIVVEESISQNPSPLKLITLPEALPSMNDSSRPEPMSLIPFVLGHSIFS